VSGLRILHVYPKDDYFTGAAIQLRELAQQLARRGHEVVVATRPSEHWARLCRQEGLAHYGVPLTSEVDVASAWRLARILRTHRIGVVHAHKGKGRTLALMAGLRVRIPVLILNRGVSFPLDRFQRRRRFLEETNRYFDTLAERPDLLRGLDNFHRDAHQIILAPATRRAFDVSQEPASVRDRYGRNKVGQRRLLISIK